MPAPVVVVLPHSDERARTLSVLRAAGHEVVGFADPIGALGGVEKDGRAHVLVTLIDFGPGTLNGLALTLMLRYRRPAIKAVFVGPPEDGHHVAGEGAFLCQPLDPWALRDAVARQFASASDLLSRLHLSAGVGASPSEQRALALL
jgi:hypothetical protein